MKRRMKKKCTPSRVICPARRAYYSSNSFAKHFAKVPEILKNYFWLQTENSMVITQMRLQK